MTEPGGELVALYLSDCEQLLQRFDAAMLEADQQDALSDPAELFRLLHTLKGSSAMMDYAPLVDVTHAFENVLSGVKSRALSLQGERCRALIEAGLDFSVYFRGQLMRIRGGGAPEENKALRLRIDALTDGLGARPAPEGGAGNAPAPSETPYQTGERSVRVRLRSCPLPHIRASIIAKSVSGLCSFLATRPERLNQATEAAGAIQADGFLIRYLPAAGAADAAILQKLAAQPYVVSCTPEEASRPDAPAAEAAQSVTVDQDTVNRLIHLLDEIATAEGAVESFVTQRGLDTGALGRLMSSLRRSVADAGVLAAEIGTHELGGVFVQMQRAVRGMARELGKEIRLKTVGADVRADQSVLEILTDSLIHIVRNAADHGIELPQTREAAGKPRAGLITLSAAKKNDLLTVTVEDDGAGIDRSAVLAQAERRGKLTKPKERYTDAEVYELLLTSGVSTSRSVTQYSGRGVGLDTVMRRIRQAGGSVTVASEAGRGTVFTLRIPLTLMVIDGIEITAESGGHVVVPANDIRHILALGPASEGIVYRGEEYAVLPFPGEKWERRSQGGYALLLAEEYGRRCLLARTVSMMTTYYGKPMPEYVVSAMGKGYLYSGCVTGADARLCCVLDAGRLIRESSERQSEL